MSNCRAFGAKLSSPQRATVGMSDLERLAPTLSRLQFLVASDQKRLDPRVNLWRHQSNHRYVGIFVAHIDDQTRSVQEGEKIRTIKGQCQLHFRDAIREKIRHPMEKLFQTVSRSVPKQRHPRESEVSGCAKSPRLAPGRPYSEQ